MTPVTVINTEADVAGINVTPAVLTTSETGTRANFSISLTSAPVAPITVTLVNGNPAQGILSQSILTFDSANWNTPQTVTVTGLDNHIVNGNQTYQIAGSASSSDSNYDGATMTPVTVVNTEGDVAGFTIAPSVLTTSGAGSQASFSVVLTSQPLAPVTVNLAADPAQGTLSQTALVFTPATWNSAQPVTVTNVVPPVAGSALTYRIQGTVAGTDALYNATAIPAITVIVPGLPAPGPSAPTLPIPTTGSPDPQSPLSPTTLISIYYAVNTPPKTVAVAPQASPPTVSLVTALNGNSPLLSIQASVLSPERALTQTVFGHVLLVAQGVQPEMFVDLPRPIPSVKIASPQLAVVASNPGTWHAADKSQTDAYAQPTEAISSTQTFAEVQGSGIGNQDESEQGIALEGWNDGAQDNSVLVATGITATAGYVLFNTRTGLWLLSLLAAPRCGNSSIPWRSLLPGTNNRNHRKTKKNRWWIW